MNNKRGGGEREGVGEGEGKGGEGGEERNLRSEKTSRRYRWEGGDCNKRQVCQEAQVHIPSRYRCCCRSY